MHRPSEVETNDEIQGGRLTIRDGKLEEFKRVACQFVQVARTKDTGTLQYELYFNEDQTECIVLERYRDVQSLLEHSDAPAIYAAQETTFRVTRSWIHGWYYNMVFPLDYYPLSKE